MSWVLYLFGSGQALFLGAGMVLAAVALIPGCKGWKAAALAMCARLGLFIAALSAVPLSYWIYALAIGLTAAWLWHARRKAAQPWPSLRWATAGLWIGIIVLELPYHFTPRLGAGGQPPLYIIGDSFTAGLDGGIQVWPDLLPSSAEVHNLAQPGATTAMAIRSQAPQIAPAGGLVLIEIGGNDLLGSTSSAQFERDLEQLLSLVVASNRTILMFELPLPPLCNEYGRIQRRLADRYHVRLIPKRILISILAGESATLDSIHLSEQGHERMARAVWTILAPVYQVGT